MCHHCDIASNIQIWKLASQTDGRTHHYDDYSHLYYKLNERMDRVKDGRTCVCDDCTHAVTRYFVAGSDEDDDSVSMPKCLQFSFFIHHFKPKSWRRRRKNKLNMQIFKMFAANNIQWGWYGLFLKRNMGTFRITTTVWKLWQFSDRNRKWNSQQKTKHDKKASNDFLTF